MAFPTVQTADTQSGTVTSNSTSWTITWPTNLASGDLILLVVATDGNPSLSGSPFGSFVSVQIDSAANHLSFSKKVSDGTETGTWTVLLSASEQGAWRIFRITGWEGTLGTVFANNASSGAVVAVTNNGTDANPDPLSVDPFNWTTENTLWIAATSVDTSRTISVYPLADLNTADISGGAGGATLGICMANDTVSSKDPGTFTISTGDDWLTATIAIRPAVGAAVVGNGLGQAQALIYIPQILVPIADVTVNGWVRVVV